MIYSIAGGIMSSYSVPTLTSGLVGWWNLDETSGNFADSSGNGNSGVPTGDAGSPVNYSQAGAGSNTGTSARINADTVGESRIDMGDPAVLRLTSTGSIAFWCNDSQLGSADPPFVSKINWATDRNGFIVASVSDHPYFEIADGTGFQSVTLSTSTMAANTWYHLAFTWDGSFIIGYVNGSAVGSPTAQTKNATSTGLNFILGRAFNGTDYVNFGLAGKMDEVGVWNRAITALEVATLYNSGAGTYYPFRKTLLEQLAGYWKLDEASGNFRDSSGNLNTGTPQGTGTPVIYAQTAAGANTVFSAEMNASGSGESRIDMGDVAALRLTSTGTVACWAKVNTGQMSNAPALICKMNIATLRDGYCMFIGGDTFVRILLADGTNFQEKILSTVLSENTWYHFAFTWDGSNVIGYINGAMVDTATAQTRTPTGSNSINFILGRGWNGTDYTNLGLDGNLDEAAVWSRALTVSEITTLYNLGAGKQHPF